MVVGTAVAPSLGLTTEAQAEAAQPGFPPQFALEYRPANGGSIDYNTVIAPATQGETLAFLLGQINKEVFDPVLILTEPSGVVTRFSLQRIPQSEPTVVI